MDIYTYVIKGNTQFVLQIPNNPIVRHMGGTTVGHVTLSKQEKQQLETYLVQTGINMTLMETPRADQEQQDIQEMMMGRKDTVYPHKDCINCSWFNPTDLTFCWLKSLRKEGMDELLKKDNYKKDMMECKVPSHWSNN